MGGKANGYHEDSSDFCLCRRPAPSRRERIAKPTKKARIYGRTSEIKVALRNKSRTCEIRKVFSTFAEKFSPMNYKTYLFDFDYTLADSSRGIVKCFRIVLTRHQYLTVTDEAIKRTIGKTLEESFSILTGVTDPAQLEAFRQEYRKEADVHMNVNTRLFPDTLSTLKELKQRGARIGIISTKYRFRILSFLEEYLPKDFLDIIVGGEDVKAAKPSPEGVRFALEHLGSTPQETLYIGDSTVDAETARNAEVDFAAVLNGMTTAEELQAYPHRMIMKNLGELVQAR